MSKMSRFMDYLTFREFIMPYVLQILFWAGIIGTLYGTWWLYVHDNWAWIMSLVFGPLLTRLIFENLILRYRIYCCVSDIWSALDKSSNDY